jgi:hypothetical protein
MRPQNWWEEFAEVLPSPAARPRPLPGTDRVVRGPAMATGAAASAFGADRTWPAPFDTAYFGDGLSGIGRISGNFANQGAPAGNGQSAVPGDAGGPALDREAVIQHAAAAIERGADPDAVRARLIQIGPGDQVPPGPFQNLIPNGQPGLMGYPMRPQVQAQPQPAFEDRGGFEASGPAVSDEQTRFGRPSQRIDPRLAPQKLSELRKSSQGGQGAAAGRPTSFAYGLPSFPSGGESRRGNPVRGPASGNGRAIGEASPLSRGASPAGLNGFGYVPPAGDENLLARFLYSEFSSSDNWRDMPAGAWTAINRIRPNGHWPRYRMDTLGTSLAEVLNKRGRDGTPQYSWVPPGGIGAPGGSARWQESAHPERLTGSARQAWLWAADTARRVLSGIDPDPTGGATYFHNRSLGVPPNTRGWFRRARTITLAPYRSPNERNFFYRNLEDPLRPVPWRAGPPPRR